MMRGILHVPVPAIFMAFVAARSFMARSSMTGPFPALAALLLSLWLAGCSSSTTVSEWSCPTDQPDGCFTVAEGDAMALGALRGAGSTGSGVTVRRTIVPVDENTSPAPSSLPDGTGGEPDILHDAEGRPVRIDGSDEAVTAGTGTTRMTGDRHDSPRGGVLGGVLGGGDMPPPDQDPVDTPPADQGQVDQGQVDQGQVDQGPVDLTLFAGGTRTGTADMSQADTPAPTTPYQITPGQITPGQITSERIVEAFADTPPPDFMPGAGSGTVSGPDMVRVPERLAEIWIGPFEDAAGNWHPAGRMFIVVTPAGWTRP